LALGKQPSDRVEADVFLLTDREPALLPVPHAGLSLAHSEPATKSLLDDLRADDGMSWVPPSAWLTKLQVDTDAGDLRFDLAVDASGNDRPSPVAAGLELPDLGGSSGIAPVIISLAAILALAVMIMGMARRQSPGMRQG
jgi:hypothetical protein